MKLEFEAENFRELRQMIIQAAIDMSGLVPHPQPPPPDALAKKRGEKKGPLDAAKDPEN